MSITLLGGNGLFNMLGKCIYAQNAVDTYRTGSLATEVTDAFVVMEGSTPSIELRDDWSNLPAAVLTAQEGLNSYVEELQSTMAATIIRLANADDPLPELTIEEALKELIEQMISGSQTVDANEPSAALSYSSSITGTTDKGRASASVIDGRGRTLQFAYAEVIDAIVTSVAAGTESEFAVKGEAAAEPMSKDWPNGSGLDDTMTAFDASGTNNLITNGDLDDFTANVPDGFTATAGSAGTDFLQETTTVFITGGKSLRIAAGGVSIALLSTTTIDLDAHTVYALGFWYRKVGTVSAGTLDISLYDGSANINDEAGTANAVQIGFGSLTTSWQLGTAYFRLPDPLPSTIKLRIRTGTAFSGGGTVYLDHLILAEAQQLYDGGPYMAVFSGNAPFELDDKITLTLTNDYRGEFQTKFQRNFDMIGLGLYLPSATGAAETIADSLVA